MLQIWLVLFVLYSITIIVNRELGASQDASYYREAMVIYDVHYYYYNLIANLCFH